MTSTLYKNMDTTWLGILVRWKHSTHQLQALVPEFTVIFLQLLRLFFQLLVVSRDLLLSLNQVIICQSLNSQLQEGKNKKVKLKNNSLFQLQIIVIK